jgi:hypothetical protein
MPDKIELMAAAERRRKPYGEAYGSGADYDNYASSRDLATLADFALSILDANGGWRLALDQPPPTQPGWYALEYKDWFAVVEVKQAFGALRFHPAPPWHSRSWHPVDSLKAGHAHWSLPIVSGTEDIPPE